MGGSKGGGGGSGKAQTTIIDIPIPKVDTTELEVVHVFPQGMGGGYGGYGGYNNYPNGIPSFSVVTQENGTTQTSNVWGFNPGSMARKLNKDTGENAESSLASKTELATKTGKGLNATEEGNKDTVNQLKTVKTSDQGIDDLSKQVAPKMSESANSAEKKTVLNSSVATESTPLANEEQTRVLKSANDEISNQESAKVSGVPELVII